jgi:glycine oxidase
VPNRSEPSDVIVIGGGVVGLAAGWRLAQRGARVTVLERAQPGSGTSHVAAGMLAPITEANLTEEPLLQLGLAAAAAYPDFCAELGATTGLDVGYLACGSLLVARDRDEAEALERQLEVRTTLGLRARRLRPTQARALEPALAPTVRLGLEVPDDHAIDPRKLAAALARAVAGSGGEVRSGAEVARLAVGEDSVDGVELADGTHVASAHVVIAAGPWSGELAGVPEHARVPIRPVKGQIMRLHDPAGPGLLSRVVRVGGAYIVPRGDGRYVLGATQEERGFDTTVAAGALFELLRDGTELLPGLSELVVDELGAGLRPGTPDNAPLIGAGAVPGLHWATGHYRNGILLAPITAELIAASVLGEPAPEGLVAPFAPARFAPDRVAASPMGARP